MDALQVAMLAIQLVLGALLGAVAWIVRDMRNDQKRRLEVVEARVGQLELLVAGQYVPRTDCRATHQDVAAKLGALDRGQSRTDAELARVRVRLGEAD